ncbi:hypothetical protein ACFFWD_43540 [Bradyrhizobium erythrophlei]|uniref:hypothetical protein n=1 Tax=Bradyrhizobium erythrophlei TaxID=1437360 RepID=UPI0035EE8469
MTLRRVVVGFRRRFSSRRHQVRPERDSLAMSSNPNIEDAGDQPLQGARDPVGAFGAGARPVFDARDRATWRRSLAPSKSVGFGVAAVGALLLLAGVDAFLAERIKELRDHATQLQKQIASVEQRVGRLELQMEQQRSRRAPDGPAGSGRSEGETAAVVKADPPVTLTRAEVDIIKDYIKLPPPAAGAAATMSVGAPVGNHVLVPLPAQITDRVPKLVGARFATDRNGAIVIVVGTSDRVGFIIPPN